MLELYFQGNHSDIPMSPFNVFRHNAKRGYFLNFFRKYPLSSDAWILDLEDIEKDTGKIIYFATKNERDSKSSKHSFKKGQLLYSKLRPYLNKVVIAPNDGYCTTEILPLELYGDISPNHRDRFKVCVNSKN